MVLEDFNQPPYNDISLFTTYREAYQALSNIVGILYQKAAGVYFSMQSHENSRNRRPFVRPTSQNELEWARGMAAAMELKQVQLILGNKLLKTPSKFGRLRDPKLMEVAIRAKDGNTVGVDGQEDGRKLYDFLTGYDFLTADNVIECGHQQRQYTVPRIWCCAKRGHAYLVWWLIKVGVDPKDAGKAGYTPLHATLNPFRERTDHIAWNSDSKVCTTSMCSPRDEDGSLGWFLKNSDMRSAKKVIQEGQAACMKLLIIAGADIQRPIPGGSGLTPLELVVSDGNRHTEPVLREALGQAVGGMSSRVYLKSYKKYKRKYKLSRMK